MPLTRFTTEREWLDAVEVFVDRPTTAARLHHLGVARESVLAVCEAEAKFAAVDGTTTATHEALATEAGVSRRLAAQIRVGLTDAGLESVIEGARVGDPLTRQLQLPRA